MVRTPRPHLRRRAFDRLYEVVFWLQGPDFPRWVCIDVKPTQEQAVQYINEKMGLA